MSEVPSFPPPGRLVDIGSHRLHLLEQGHDEPTVVLVATAGDNLLNWHHLQPELALFSHVVAYDRSGMGWSQPTIEPVTMESMVKELYLLLINSELKGPFILVGHSVGAIITRRFAEQFPAMVAGLVLIDPAVEDEMTKLTHGDKISQFFQMQADFLQMLVQKSHVDIVSILRGKDQRPLKDLSNILQAKFDRMRPSQVRAIIAEYDAALVAVRKPYAMKSLGDLPLTILSATIEPHSTDLSLSDKRLFVQEFQKLHAALAELSSNSRHIFVEDAGHYIHDDNPDAVAEAIKAMVDAIKPQFV